MPPGGVDDHACREGPRGGGNAAGGQPVAHRFRLADIDAEFAEAKR